ncbi:MAG: succinate dehydrogenase, cytochrome b556 subunit, partial [Alphaproteobacteria bacterium]|nr:succinate dehydrogenase, cytochrome b556 subunit [Alphaproteobacteria bacterium]
PECFASAQAFIGSVIGRVLLLSWVWALFYHLCNGIRHLFWDAGVGYELTALYRSGWAVVVVSAGLTLLAFVVGYASRGGS